MNYYLLTAEWETRIRKEQSLTAGNAGSPDSVQQVYKMTLNELAEIFIVLNPSLLVGGWAGFVNIGYRENQP